MCGRYRSRAHVTDLVAAVDAGDGGLIIAVDDALHAGAHGRDAAANGAAVIDLQHGQNQKGDEAADELDIERGGGKRLCLGNAGLHQFLAASASLVRVAVVRPPSVSMTSSSAL